MGVNLVLLPPVEDEDLSMLLGNELDNISNPFEEFRPWDPETVSKERIVWLNITGIPLHAWSEDFLKLMTSSVGKYVNVDESTRMK